MMAKKDGEFFENLEELRTACGKLKLQLAEALKDRDGMERRYSDTLHSYLSLLASLDCCMMKLSESLVIERAWNSYNVFRSFVEGRNLADVLVPDWAKQYFVELFSGRDAILTIAGRNEDRTWERLCCINR